jgi:DHA2 family multidrug resistance protein
VSHVTLQSTSAGIVQAILVQGVGFSFLFVPLTTAALSNVPRHKLADATGLNSLLRQVGASMGLALFATLLGRYGARARAAVSSHVSIDRPEVQDRLAQLTSFFAQKGFDPVSAKQAALGALNGTIARQGMVIAFEQVLLVTAVTFLCVLPLLFFLKVKRGPSEKVHVEMET